MRDLMSKLYHGLLLLLLGGLVLSLSFLSPTPTYAQSDGEKDLLETAVDAGEFRVLVALLKAADLDETLQGEGPFTIFAPTDTAFTKIPLPKIRELRDDPNGALTEVLLLHGVSGKLTAVDVVSVINGEADVSEITSLSDIPLAFAEEDGVVTVNGAAIVTTDIEASNGIIHVIDTVLLPPSLQDAQAAAEADSEDADSEDEGADGEEADGEEANSNDANAEDTGPGNMGEGADSEEADGEGADSEEADGEGADSEEADGEEADGEGADGEEADSEEADGEEADSADAESEASEEADSEDAESEDSVDEDSETADESSAESSASALTADLIDTASAAGNFTTLVAAIYTADLVDTLRGEGPFTVFAPSDAVFSALPSGSVQEMLEMPVEELADVLLLHVVPGVLLAEDLVGLVNSDIETVDEKQLPIRANEIGLTIGGAVIVATNIETSNGVIHVIDGLLSEEGMAMAAAESAPAPVASAPEQSAPEQSAPEHPRQKHPNQKNLTRNLWPHQRRHLPLRQHNLCAAQIWLTLQLPPVTLTRWSPPSLPLGWTKCCGRADRLQFLHQRMKPSPRCRKALSKPYWPIPLAA